MASSRPGRSKPVRLDSEDVADSSVSRGTVDQGDKEMRCARASTAVRLLLAWAFLALSLAEAPAARLLSFVDRQHGWMAGFGAEVYRTDDGGRSWRKQPTPAGGPLRAIFFVDAQTGYAVGNAGTVVHTSDSGETWNLCTGCPAQADLLDVFFCDAGHGWAVGDLSTFVRTKDGGRTWQSSRIDPLSGPLTGVSFAPSLDPEFNGGPSFGLVVSAGGGIFRTLNGGKTWRVRKFNTANPLHAVVAVNPLDWASGAFNNFVAGLNGTFVTCWYKDYPVRVLDGQPDLRALDFIDDQTGWVVGEAGCIRKTKDGGKTWELQNVRPFDLEAVKCVDSDHAWALSEPMPTGRILFMTVDGGVTWNETPVPPGSAAEGMDPDIPETAPDEPFRVFVPEGNPISDRLILPYRRPLAGETSTEMSVRACCGEYEPATFAVRSSVPLTNVFVKVGDLRGDAVIPADSVDVKWIKCWYQTHDFKASAALVSELLLNNDALVSVGSPGELPPMKTEELADSDNLQPLNLAAGFTKQVWLTVHVPEDAQPGPYAGKITITADGQPTRTLGLQVHVLPFTLEHPMLDYGLCITSELRKGNLYGRMYTRTPEQLRSLMANLRAHGITHPFVAQPISIIPAAGHGTGVPWQEVKYDSTCLRKYLATMDELGFPKDKLFWGNSYMMRYINYAKHEKVGDPKVKKWPPEAFMPTLNIVTGLAEDFGYGEVYFAGMDEVSKTQLQFQRTLFEMMGKANTPVPAKAHSHAGKPSDVYDATHMSIFPAANDIAAYQATGRRVYIYANPGAGREQPYTYRRNVGLLLYKSGVNGTGWWADYSYIGGVFDDCFVYHTNTGQIDTLQWEGWREGCDDVRYLTTLHRAVEAARGERRRPAAASKAEAWLASLKTTDDAHWVRRQAIEHITALRSP